MYEIYCFVCLSLSSHLRVSYEKGRKVELKMAGRKVKRNGGKESVANSEAGRNIAQLSTLRRLLLSIHSPLTDFRFVREGQYE
jgi:hypothetical protein